MEHQGTVTLETPRLTLRRFHPEDAEAAFRNWMGSEEVHRFLCGPAHRDVSVTRRVLSDWAVRYDRLDFYQWAIVPREVGEPVGSISAADLDERVGMARVGYSIGVPWQGRGYMTEALRRVIAFLFEEVRFSRIEARHDPDNPASGRVMIHCGLRHEGTLRQADWNNRGIVDACVYGLLARDYFAKDNRKE